MPRSKLLFLVSILLSGLLVAADQWTKGWIVHHFIPGEYRSLVPGYFGLTLTYNTGAAFGFLAGLDGQQRWFFVVVALGMSLFLLVWLARLETGCKLQAVALALILGGALGNLQDRVELGYVVDFILFHFGSSWFFPTFNLADAGISVGAVLVLLEQSVFATGKDRKGLL
ncbi:MAG: signal peptidase II [Kistimonas sp.]|nr:signal peptidase II [Kistimonas sp.]